MRSYSTILMTGATGYLGSLAACSLLAHTDSILVLPIRERHTRESLLKRLSALLAQEGLEFPESEHSRIITPPLPPLHQMDEILPLLKQWKVEEIIHCAGCLNYFDVESLTEVNIDLTRKLLELGQKINLKRFVYLSTAFSSGYIGGLIEETLHPSPQSDPTDYTRTKREAENLIGNQKIPYLIIRPSIVIGDSRNGRYGGKPYGIYQVMVAYERLMSDHYAPVLHVMAPSKPLPLIHQNSFQSGFEGAYFHLPDNSIIHLVSKSETLPSVRDLWDFWVDHCFRPQEAYYYERLEDLPLGKIDLRQRTISEYTSVNMEISSHQWNFQDRTLRSLRDSGCRFFDTTKETLTVCAREFLQNSPKYQNYLARFGPLGAVTTQKTVVSPSKVA